MVGCVVVKNRRIVGEGYHKQFGGWHAEVYALRKAGKQAKGSTLFVNLEPCSHYGKTPPCVEAIIAAGVKRVVVATLDPNPLVSGKGIRALRRSGIDVFVGAGKEEAGRLNEKFITFMKTGRPFVGVKIAQSLDARIADSFGHSKWITSKASRAYGHFLRSTYDAVLVGAQTVVRDNPNLTVRHVNGRNPLRVVLDGRLVTNPKFKIFNTRVAPTLLVTSMKASREKSTLISYLMKKGVQVITLKRTGQFKPRSVLRLLGKLGISSVLIEGGAKTVSEFLEERLVQKVHCFTAPKFLGGGLHSFSKSGSVRLSEAISLGNVELKQFGSDILIEGVIV